MCLKELLVKNHNPASAGQVPRPRDKSRVRGIGGSLPARASQRQAGIPAPCHHSSLERRMPSEALAKDGQIILVRHIINKLRMAQPD